MTLNRKIQPEIAKIQKINFSMPSEYTLDNGIKVYCYDDSIQPIIKIDFLFDAGSKYAQNYKIPVLVNKLLLEGTLSKTSEEIALIIDSCGAFLHTESTIDHGQISLSVLHKHLGSMLPLVAELIEEASFNEDELDIFLAQKEQELLINNQKVSFVARNMFPSLLYGQNHVFGRPTKIEDYTSINQNQLIDFYQKYYKSKQFDVFVSGSLPKDFITTMNQYFGKEKKEKVMAINLDEFETSTIKKHQFPFQGAMQNAIRLGRFCPNRQHPDFAAMQVLVTIFGGYFGSRLMTNIREDKGYTYGIGSGVRHHQNYSSYLFIGTEVKSENYLDVLIEIEKEMVDLKTKLVDEQELNTVKTVMLGAIQRGFDGSFARADRFKELMANHLDLSYFENYVSQINLVKQEDILRLASEYFNLSDFYEFTVGKF